VKRYEKNPIITSDMVKPSNPGYEVKGVFNPGAAVLGDEVILLLRVAETCVQKEGFVAVPVIRIEKGRVNAEVLEFSLSDPEVSLQDTRGISYKGTDYLSTLSHIRLARSVDGYNFEIEGEPFLFPDAPEEVFGVEDPRVTFLEGFYYINYTVVSPDGWATALARTRDFKAVEKMGIIFCPENKDVSIFPGKVNNRYHALHRPDNSIFGKPSIWYAESEDLLHWGGHRCLVRPKGDRWEDEKIGGGPPCVETPEGWLQIYHGKAEDGGYSLFGLLLDLNDPCRILKRSKEPILRPEADYEKKGFYGNCVFSNGLVEKDDGTLLIYYGASDCMTCVAETSVDEVLKML